MRSLSRRAPGLLVTAFAATLFGAALPAPAQQGTTVRNTLHNLSVSGPGETKALKETEICKFCHIPHTPVVKEGLWGHALPKTAQYAVPTIRKAKGIYETAPQPDGVSRLCLSCHDGTVALGDLGPRRPQIQMRAAPSLSAGRKGHLGTDLSGSHPISFEMPATDPGRDELSRDIGLRSLDAVRTDRQVRLDKNGKVQCTSCHDPHADRFFKEGEVPHFWVKPSVGEVCLTCHEIR